MDCQCSELMIPTESKSKKEHKNRDNDGESQTLSFGPWPGISSKGTSSTKPKSSTTTSWWKEPRSWRSCTVTSDSSNRSKTNWKKQSNSIWKVCPSKSMRNLCIDFLIFIYIKRNSEKQNKWFLKSTPKLWKVRCWKLWKRRKKRRRTHLISKRVTRMKRSFNHLLKSLK